MKHLLKCIAIALITYIILTFAVWLFNGSVHTSDPPSSILITTIIILWLLPALISGYIGGRLAGKHGLRVGFASNIVAILIMGFSFFPYIFERDIYGTFIGILISTLAGGVGELNAAQAKNA